MTAVDSPDNREQIEYWNGKAGATWVEAQETLDTMLAPIGDALVERAAVRDGERVVDVGCGCGDTSLALASRGAAVWGIDISEPMLARARDRARARGLANVAFACTDAASQSFTPDHDLVVSRFGVMFFADPYAAFANLRTALKDQGRLLFACWQPPRQNPWMAIAGQAVQPFLSEPAAPPDPRAPGPFAFADADYVRDILSRGGFSDVELQPCTPVLHVGDDLESAVSFMQQVGPLSRALAELEGDERQRALDAARKALEPHLTADGLNLGAASWIVRAHAG